MTRSTELEIYSKSTEDGEGRRERLASPLYIVDCFKTMMQVLTSARPRNIAQRAPGSGAAAR